MLLTQGANLLGYVEANNWFYALIAITAMVVIGSYVSQAMVALRTAEGIADQQFLDD